MRACVGQSRTDGILRYHCALCFVEATRTSIM